MKNRLMICYNMTWLKSFFANWTILEYVIGGVIGAIIAVLINCILSLFRMKRKKYCISKALVSSSVYQQTNKDGLKISVSYNDKEIDGQLSIMTVRLRNDGEEDLMYSQRVSHLFFVLDGFKAIDVSVYADIEGINPIVSLRSDGYYELKWDLLKRDESLFIRIVVEGEPKDITTLKFDVRADGINDIKTPEFKVMDLMGPAFVTVTLIGIPVALFWPADESFVGIMPMKVFLLLSLLFFALFVLIMALIRRIAWLKEQ